MKNSVRAGIGYDAHPLAAGRRLVLGGVEIPFEKGLEGWSDADVLTHAVMDALLGAAALGDIGRHFPPGEARYKDISSLVLLKEVKKKLDRAGWQIGNIDATIIAERPRLQEYVHKIRQNLSSTLGVDIGCVSVKGKTTNGLGFSGRGDGIAAQAVAMIVTKE